MASTIIGKSIVIEGDISGQEGVVIQGTVKGSVTTSEDIQVEEGAVVEAEMEGADVTVSGQVTGTVKASGRLELTAEGRVVGDVKAARISFAEGSTFKGNVDMDL